MKAEVDYRLAKFITTFLYVPTAAKGSLPTVTRPGGIVVTSVIFRMDLTILER